MARTFDRFMVLATGALVGLVILDAVLSFRNVRQLKEDAHWVEHTHQVIDKLNELQHTLHEAQAAMGGYLLTRDRVYLDKFHPAVRDSSATIDQIQALTEDNPSQQARIEPLRQRCRLCTSTLANMVALIEKNRTDDAQDFVRRGEGSRLMAHAEAVLGEMKQEEKSLLLERSQATEQAYRFAILALVLAAVLALTAIALVAWVTRRFIQARSQTAEILREQQELLQATLASIGDGVIATDAAGKVTFLNPVAQVLTGWTQAEAVGQSLQTIFHIVNEETRHTVENPALRALAQGVVVGLANHTLLVARDGTERPIDDSAAPIRNSRHEAVGAVLVFRDITERKAAELSLRESEERFRTLIEQIREHAIFAIDLEGRVTSWNEGVHRVLGYEEAEFLGQDIKSLIFTPEDIETGIPELELQQAAQNNVAGDDRWMRKKNGERFWASGLTYALRDAGGRRVGYTKVMRDQTNLKKMEVELRQFAADLSEADRKKNEFLAMLAHELRNPLAPIRNAVNIIRESGDAGDVVMQATEMMQRQVAQMVRLIDDLLDISRISRGKIELKTDRVELAAVIGQAVEAVRPQADSKNHQLAIHLPSQPLVLLGDPARLAQVVGNLLNNACKFTEPGGHIELFADRSGNSAVVRVTDDGIGMTQEQMAYVFEMFTQVDASLERSQSGLGIGLTLVKSLVEMHGGTVAVRSQGLGRGSEFTVTLPLSDEPVAAPTAAASVQQERAEQQLILVVDDNRDAAESLAMVLKISGHKVATAFDGLEAVQAAASLRPSVVLLDIGLPKLSGYEVARQIRSQPGGEAVLLIAMTGWGQQEDRTRSATAGFDHHLVKPVDPASLQALLARR